MSKRFLTRELIICKAFKMIDESGLNAFSVRGLAAELGVQVSSLYNHIHNENDLLIEVAKRAGDLYTQIIKGTMYGLPLDEATVKAGEAFSDFVTKHKYLYELLLDRRLIGTPEFEDASDSPSRSTIFWSSTVSRIKPRAITFMLCYAP